MRVRTYGLTPENREKYVEIATAVFDRVDPTQIRDDASRFDETTRFYAIEVRGAYLSVLFVRPVQLAGEVVGGIGGVCTRRESRGLGYGRLVLDATLARTRHQYPALLLWTRVPTYFERHGFSERLGLFADDAKGSLPMMLVHDPGFESRVAAMRDLPRDYF